MSAPHRHARRDPAELVRRQAKTARRELADAERILEFLRELEAPASVERMRGDLAGRGHRFSSWRLRALLRYLVARRDALEVRNAVPGRRTVLFRAKAQEPST